MLNTMYGRNNNKRSITMKTLLTIAILAFTIQPVLACPATYTQWVGGVEQPIPTGCTYYDGDNNGVSELINSREDVSLRPQREDESDEEYARIVAAYNAYQNEDLSAPEEHEDFKYAPVLFVAVIGLSVWYNWDAPDIYIMELDEKGYQTLEPVMSYDSETKEIRYGVRYNIAF